MIIRFTPVGLPLTRVARALAVLAATFALTGAAHAADAASAAAATAASAPLAAGTKVAVKPGQSLNDIAIEVTASHDHAIVARAAHALFDANPSAFMSNDPSRLRLGSTLTVPALDANGAPVASSEAGAASASGAASTSGAGASAPAAAAAPASNATLAKAGAAASASAAAASTPAATTSNNASAAAAAASSSPAAAANAGSSAGNAASLAASASNGEHSVSGAIQSSQSAATSGGAAAGGGNGASQPVVSSLQQLLALKNRVLQELDHSNGRAASNVASTSAAPAAATSGAASSAPASAAAPATASNGNPAGQMGAPIVAGAAVAALVVGWLLRRRKRHVHAEAVAFEPPADGEGWPKPGSLAYDARKAAANTEAIDVEAHTPGEVVASEAAPSEAAEAAEAGHEAGGEAHPEAHEDTAQGTEHETGRYEGETVHAADVASGDAAANELMGAVSAAHEAEPSAEAVPGEAKAAAPSPSRDEATPAEVASLDETPSPADAWKDLGSEAVPGSAGLEEAEAAEPAPIKPPVINLEPPLPPLVPMDEKIVEHTPTLPATPTPTPAPMLHDMLAGMLAAEASRATAKLKSQVPQRSYSAVQPPVGRAAPSTGPVPAPSAEVSGPVPAAAQVPAAFEATTEPVEPTLPSAELPHQHETEGAAPTVEPTAHETHEARSGEPLVGEPQQTAHAAEASQTEPQPNAALEPQADEAEPAQTAASSAYEPQPAHEPETFTQEPQPAPSAEGLSHEQPQAVPVAEAPAHEPQHPGVAEEPWMQAAEPSHFVEPSSQDQPLPHAYEGFEAEGEAQAAAVANAQAEPDDAEIAPPSHAQPPRFPQEAIDAFGSLGMGLPPRDETAAAQEPSLWQPQPEAGEVHAEPPHQPGEHVASAEPGYGQPQGQDHAHDPSSPYHAAAEPGASTEPSSALFENNGNATHALPNGHVAHEADPHADAEPPHAADEIAAGIVGPASVAGLGAAPFGAMNLDFDLDLPPASEEPPAFTPAQLARIARNKLDLANEYIELGDLGGARTLIHEVIESNDTATRDEARALLSSLAPLS